MNDYYDDIYERYMCTGEGAEYFENSPEECDEEYSEEYEDASEFTENEQIEFNLDELNKVLDRRIAELERMIESHKNKDTTVSQ